jgi:trans-aconitate methyltransferase
MRTTKQHHKFWKERKIDWKTQYLDTWNHPHRAMIASLLGSFTWVSLWEVGCGAGANIRALIHYGFKDRQMGGSDISPDAIEVAKQSFTGGRFRVETIEDLFLSDKASDVLLTDAALIYIGPEKIRGVLKELKRTARIRVVMCEFHSTDWWKAFLFKLKTGYNVYNYEKLLSDAGFYDVQFYKLPPEAWPGSGPGDGWYEFGYLITAKV